MRQQLAAGVGRAAIATLPLLLAFVTLALAPRGAAAQQRSDAELLLAFKLALGVENEVLDSWQGTEACGGTWTGVVCENARVIGIDLNDKSLRGYLPVTLVLPDTLQRLNMGGNKLRGPLPETFHMPAALRDIQLCCNSLAGPLPAGWVPSPHLDTLSLDHNKLDGTLPANWKLPENFRLLNLHENKFMGTLPTWAGSKASVAVTPGNTGLCGDVPKEPLYGNYQPSVTPYPAVTLPACPKPAGEAAPAGDAAAAAEPAAVSARPRAAGAAVTELAAPAAEPEPEAAAEAASPSSDLGAWAFTYALAGFALLVATLRWGSLRARRQRRRSDGDSYTHLPLARHHSTERRRRRKPLVT